MQELEIKQSNWNQSVGNKWNNMNRFQFRTDSVLNQTVYLFA